ncbi:MAG: DUF6445 family protein, partial [Steroidobacter sp.]
QSKSQFYPGIRAPEPREYGNTLYEVANELAPQVFGWSKGVEITACDFSLVTKAPKDLIPIQRVPHIDYTDPDGLAALHYLCSPQHGGTSFYRHRSTGYELILADNVQHFVATANDEIRALGVPPVQYFDGDTAQFERIARYEAKYNRLLIYRGAILHSANPPVDFVPDLNPRIGRLTVNTFLRRRY